jgi:hypothetical protein
MIRRRNSLPLLHIQKHGPISIIASDRHRQTHEDDIHRLWVERGSIIRDLNIGNQSLSFILLQYFHHHVIQHHTYPTMTQTTTVYLDWTYVRSMIGTISQI